MPESDDELRFPDHWRADVLASDGGTVHVRPIIPADADALTAFHGGLSLQTRYFRFFSPYPSMPQKDLRRFTEVDHHDRVALVGVLGSEIIAVGRFDRLDDPETAEVAFVVADAHQGRGLGSILLEHLAAAAAEVGVRQFQAEVMAQNNQMVRVFRQAGYAVTSSFEDSVLTLSFRIDPTERSLAVVHDREQAAEARSVRNLLHPGSVAVIGASAEPTKVGHAVLANLLAAPAFHGPVYPVHPRHRAVHGVRAYSSVLDIPDDVDLAVVATPPEGVHAVVAACLSKAAKAMVLLTGQLSDSGEAEPLQTERALVDRVRAHGMRLVGPNALGVVNTDPNVRLNASLAPVLPGPGTVGFFCQSGALGIGILASAAERGLGLSTFVSAGNRADVSGNDLLQYWETDASTEVVLLYLESFGNPRKFARLARRLGRSKPVVVVKSGSRAVRQGLAATSVEIEDSSVEALFEQSGVIRVDSLEELFDTGVLLAYQPLPAGNTVAIVGNSSALGVLAADAARSSGLRVMGDPVDIGAEAGPDHFATAIEDALARTDVDSVITAFAPPVAVPSTAYAQRLRMVTQDAGKPVLSTFLAAAGIPDQLAVRGESGEPVRGSVPSFPSPERAVAALARVAGYARWRNRSQGNFRTPDGVDVAAARRIVAGCGELTRRVPMPDREVVRLLDCFGVEIAEFELAGDAEAAVAAAARLAGPVALKAADPEWRHRTDMVGVRLDLTSAEQVRRAYRDLARLSGARQVYVQRMAPRGLSCSITIHDDRAFGSVIGFGLSGVISELLGDRSYRAVPLSDVDAAELIRAPRAAPMLAGYAGGVHADMAALEQLALRAAAVAEEITELRSLRLDPVLAAPAGAVVTGAEVTLGPPPYLPDAGPRRLRTLP